MLSFYNCSDVMGFKNVGMVDFNKNLSPHLYQFSSKVMAKFNNGDVFCAFPFVFGVLGGFVFGNVVIVSIRTKCEIEFFAYSSERYWSGNYYERQFHDFSISGYRDFCVFYKDENLRLIKKIIDLLEDDNELFLIGKNEFVYLILPVRISKDKIKSICENALKIYGEIEKLHN